MNSRLKGGILYELVSKSTVLPSYELGFRYMLDDPLYLSGELAYMFDFDANNPPGAIVKAAANLDYRVTTFMQIFHTYLVMGGGIYNNNGFDLTNFRAGVNVGAGLQINVLNNIDFFLDVRDLILIQPIPLESVLQATAGIGFGL